MKKLAVILILIAYSTMAMAQAQAHSPNDPNFSKNNKSGQNLKYTITSNKEPYTVIINGINGDTEKLKKLEIPSTVNYRNTDFAVTAINKAAFSGISSLTSITIPPTVKEIKTEAFNGCSALKTIKIGGVIEKCEEKVFTGTAIAKPIYTGNTLVYYPANQKEYLINEGTETILEYAFSDCNDMTSIVIPASVKNIYANSFANCDRLESIVVADGNKTFDSRNNCNAIILTSENKIIKGFKNTTIPNGIKSIARIAFANTGISKIDIPNSVTTIEDSAFYNCELTSITIPESVKKIGANAFIKNKKLTVVNFGAIECEAMNKDFPAFEQCQSFSSVNFGDKVKVVPAFSFKDCPELRYVTLSNSVIEIGKKAFSECKMLSYLELSNSVEIIGDSCFYESGISEPVHSEILFAYFPPNYDTEYSIPQGIKTIAKNSFHYAGNLKTLTIPNSVTKIEENAFCDCLVETIIMPDSLETIETGAFLYCTNLKSIKLPNTLKTINNKVFMGCFKIEDITIPNSVTEIKDLTFYDSGLKTITLPISINKISGSAFNQCLDLKNIYIPKGSMSQFKNILDPKFHSKLKEK
ncbi:MAG: leucine-rich repeat domain-containing protein [Bacteroidales bacterium]|nr:leucine-rich repeat domain-containing protein [Bacteroidales bacterium]